MAVIADLSFFLIFLALFLLQPQFSTFQEKLTTRNCLTIELFEGVCACVPARQPNAFFSGYSMHLVIDAAVCFASDPLVCFHTTFPHRFLRLVVDLE